MRKIEILLSILLIAVWSVNADSYLFSYNVIQNTTGNYIVIVPYAIDLTNNTLLTNDYTLLDNSPIIFNAMPTKIIVSNNALSFYSFGNDLFFHTQNFTQISNTITVNSTATGYSTSMLLPRDVNLTIKVKPIAKTVANYTFIPNFTTYTKTISVGNNASAVITINQIPKINRIVNLNYSGNYINTLYNISVYAPAFPKINKIIDLNFSGAYINTQYNLSVYPPAFPKINKVVYLNFSGNYINPAYNLSVYPPVFPKINLAEVLGFGQVYSNSLYNITIQAENITANSITPKVLTEYYANKIAPYCVKNITVQGANSIPLHLCISTNSSQPSLLDYCTAKQILSNNYSLGLGECLIDTINQINQTVAIKDSIIATDSNTINSLMAKLQTANQTIQNLNVAVQTGENVAGAVFLVIAGGIAILTYLEHKKKERALIGGM